jgi:hypothetical protein
MFLHERHNSPTLLCFLDCLCTKSPLNAEAMGLLPDKSAKQEILLQFNDLSEKATSLAVSFEGYKKDQDSLREKFACEKARDALSDIVEMCQEFSTDKVGVSNYHFRIQLARAEDLEKALARLECLPDLMNQHREFKNFVDEFNATKEQLDAHLHKIRKLHVARNRWHLALTLIKNPSLRKYRKSVLYKGPTKAEKLLQEIEQAKKDEEAAAKKAKRCPCCVTKTDDGADALNDRQVVVTVDSSPPKMGANPDTTTVGHV